MAQQSNSQKCTDKRNIIFSLHSNVNIGHPSNYKLFWSLIIYICLDHLSEIKKHGKRVALTTGKRTLMWGIQSGSIRNGNKTSKTIKPEEKSVWTS
jgi:hypothetical protein